MTSFPPQSGPRSGQPDQPGESGDSVHLADIVNDGDEAWAMLGYLGVPFIGVLAPVIVYLLRARTSPYVRRHVTQALNLSITLAMYNICALILAAMLALDAIGAALLIALPVAVALWVITLLYLVRAAVRASLGEYYQLPRWICATIAH
jgi:uncharacterized Tic20 family protein